MIPSENALAQIYDCSRSTIRRALGELQKRGYIQTLFGSGSCVIYRPLKQMEFMFGRIETFKETAIRNHFEGRTEVVFFEELVADENVSEKTDMPVGTELIEVHRVRYINGKPLILDKHHFLKDAVRGLDREIASNSIYEYLEGVLGMRIMTSKRRVKVERADDCDKKFLELGEFNCVAVVSSRTYNSEGIQFEYTQSRHHPDFFCFEDTATRKSID